MIYPNANPPRRDPFGKGFLWKGILTRESRPKGMPCPKDSFGAVWDLWGGIPLERILIGYIFNT